VHRTVRDQAALAKLFETIGPRFKARPGGYTRLIHTSNRVGDNAPMSILELVEKSEKTEPAEKASPPKKGEEKKTEAASGDQGKGEKKPAKEKKAKAEGEKK
jgi:large subunit ribosomal protein L17